jgi:acetyl esterase/lipase
MAYINTKLNVRLEKLGKGDHLVDTSRICLSGGSAGGYLAMIAGLDVPRRATDQDVGGYRGERGSSGIKCIAPFYPITDLTDPFWATETNPVPWYGKV